MARYSGDYLCLITCATIGIKFDDTKRRLRCGFCTLWILWIWRITIKIIPLAACLRWDNSVSLMAAYTPQLSFIHSYKVMNNPGYKLSLNCGAARGWQSDKSNPMEAEHLICHLDFCFQTSFTINITRAFFFTQKHCRVILKLVQWFIKSEWS